MARIVKEVKKPHPCRVEIEKIDSTELWFGTIIECSCGKRFIKREDQRGGVYWTEFDGDYDG